MPDLVLAILELGGFAVETVLSGYERLRGSDDDAEERSSDDVSDGGP
ncbi:hypothetical protein [Haloterrigena alkaliphila]|uniref:Uncharacterized protein n=1 Tax=Haloterrigena alkaliphila TaxID=2816475 RepID=A0A8A2VHR9_9EURY|nr:hypothetical protein [Haloterrigena alkaliphila]QSX00208.1 hypothetical protein J0X25_04380 [Haloterrigena alkaliphila]